MIQVLRYDECLPLPALCPAMLDFGRRAREVGEHLILQRTEAGAERERGRHGTSVSPCPRASKGETQGAPNVAFFVFGAGHDRVVGVDDQRAGTGRHRGVRGMARELWPDVTMPPWGGGGGIVGTRPPPGRGSAGLTVEDTDAVAFCARGCCLHGLHHPAVVCSPRTSTSSVGWRCRRLGRRMRRQRRQRPGSSHCG